MSAKTKIVVLRMKELIYTGIFVGLAILLVVLFLTMFSGKKKDADDPEAAPTASYIPGVYTASLALGSQNVDVEVVVDASQITGIRLLNLDEAVATMYPLMEPTLASLAEQILSKQSTQDITYTENTKYTSYILLQAVQTALDKAAAPK
ncbi:MAG: hypothetical protein HFI38_13735 [Lachnospiraceae bacterium]|nr:hypothetical protein [Lachnospiraceae bacterium]